MEIVRNRKNLLEKMILKSFLNNNQNSVLMEYTILIQSLIVTHSSKVKEKPIYPGFPVLKLSKILMYETYNGKLQPYFAEKIYNFIIWTVIVLY